MKYIKKFETYSEDLLELCPSCFSSDYLMDLDDDKPSSQYLRLYLRLKCNWCGWEGKEDDLILYLDKDEEFAKYRKNNKPKKGIDFKDYNNPDDYFKDAYPDYFLYKKYNL